MINNFMCERCDHYTVCEKLKPLTKFHESAKKDLMITLTMESCVDFAPDGDGDDKEGDSAEAE